MERINSQANIQSMLQTLRAYQAQAAGSNETLAPGGDTTVAAPKGQPFMEAVKSTLNSVNDLQLKARDVSTAYERGEAVPLTDVVLSMQKSSMAFEATLQVRNKVLKAYEDILNMPV